MVNSISVCRSSLLACFINFALGIHQSYFSVPVFTISTVDRRETNFAAVDEIKNSNALVPRWSCSKVIILNGKRRELEEQWGKKNIPQLVAHPKRIRWNSWWQLAECPARGCPEPSKWIVRDPLYGHRTCVYWHHSLLSYSPQPTKLRKIKNKK